MNQSVRYEPGDFVTLVGDEPEAEPSNQVAAVSPRGDWLRCRNGDTDRWVHHSAVICYRARSTRDELAAIEAALAELTDEQIRALNEGVPLVGVASCDLDPLLMESRARQELAESLRRIADRIQHQPHLPSPLADLAFCLEFLKGLAEPR